MLYFRWTRAILKRFAPAPSQEASDTTIQNEFFVASAGYKEDGQLAISASIHGEGDPGYGFTSRVIAECAMLLAQEKWNPDSQLHKRRILNSSECFWLAFERSACGKKISFLFSCVNICDSIDTADWVYLCCFEIRLVCSILAAV
ncbi:unnamed protein product [Albugo candida]|uniref:Uncharacterized protein n=1 Tax=Albugo candida TaxID=65357 RepID=A0A024GDW7_9STRA|nr:unnamed protein product [Albugo candida]|eukprot:CCI45066.1 unnamed protein product [Albugo candida]